MEGWIKLHRKMLNWEWMDNPNMVTVFLHCLLNANYEDKEYKGELIRRGELVTSIRKLAKETGLTVQQARNTLDKLISTQSITKWISPSNHTIIRVTEYEKYQDNTNFNTQTTHNNVETQHTYLRNKNIPNSNYIYNAHAREEPRVIGHLNVKTSESKKLFADKVKLKRA